MSEFIQVMTLPFVACVILTGIHVYLGFHVIERQVIFVDLALAQIAALGSSVALLLGHDIEGTNAYWISLAFTMLGAALFSWTRIRERRIPQEALIGIVYAVAAAMLVLVLSRTGQGDEHIRHALVGNILLVNWKDIAAMCVIYSCVGLLLFYFRRPFMLISQDPERAFQQGLNVKFWDFLFYAAFGFVVTSSVKIAGVLLVFSFLIVPSVCAMLFSDNLKTRLILGWVIGLIASLLGMTVSYFGDLPTGASVVCVFGFFLLVLGLIKSKRL